MLFRHIILAALAGTTLMVSSSGDLRRPGEPIGSTNGAVAISTHHIDGGREMNVVLLVDEGQADGKVDRVFVLQATGGSMQRIELRIPQAQVDWKTGVVWVHGDSGRRLALTINREAESASEDGQVFHGFGLLHSVGWDLPWPDQRLADEDYLELFGGWEGDKKCADTDPPHTSCELDPEKCSGKKCSVKCSAGTEACCECSEGKPSCKCQEPN